MFNDKTLSYFEQLAGSAGADYGAQVALANIYILRDETERALSVLRTLRKQNNSDYGEYATFTLNLYNFFPEGERPYMQYRSYEEIAESIFEKRIRHNWDFTHMNDYFSLLEGSVSAKFVPYAMTDVLEFFYLNDDFKASENVIATICKNYPQSWWDGWSRKRKLDIEQAGLFKNVKRFKELVTLMEFKKKSGILQEQSDINERLALVEELGKATKKYEDGVLNLAQRYKNFKFIRRQIFEVARIFEELGSSTDVIRILSNVNNSLGDYDEGKRAHFDLGMYYFKTDNYQLALQFFQEHIIRYDKCKFLPQATFMIGKIFQAQNRKADAIAFFKKVTLMDDETWKKEASGSALDICKALYNEKKYREALDVLGEMRTVKFDDSTMAEATFMEGSCNRDLALTSSEVNSHEYSKKAIEIFRHLIERYPTTTFSAMASVSLHEIESGSLRNSIMINRISNIIIFSLFVSFFALLGYSYMQSDNAFFYFIMVVQVALLVIGSIFATSFKVLGKFWEAIFG